jgi:hypothetical protein
VGSLVVVGRAEKPRDGAPEAPALVRQGLQLYPSTGEPVSASNRKTLAFFLAARTAGGRAAPRALVELRQGDSPVFQARGDFAVEAAGCATLLGGVPLDSVAAGDYELRVTVEDGGDRAIRWARVTIAP